MMAPARATTQIASSIQAGLLETHGAFACLPDKFLHA
jgi:hypothetical protein